MRERMCGTEEGRVAEERVMGRDESGGESGLGGV